MNRFFKAVSVVAVAVCFAIIGCGGGEGGSGGAKGGKLSGTYVNDQWKTSYTFSGNKITVSMADKVTLEGTFTTQNGVLTVTSKDKTESSEYTVTGNELRMKKNGMETVFIKQ
jgi:hypothetical protein